jgi:putative flippase GtrA
MNNKFFLKNFFIPKLKFAATSAIATSIDYLIYLLLNRLFELSETESHAISYACGMFTNFILQMKFVFDLKRKLNHAFILSVIFSLVGYGLSNLIFNALLGKSISVFRLIVLDFNIIPRIHAFFSHNDIIAKIIVTGIIFFYNFYTKRFSFEKKISNLQFKKN